MGNRLKTVPYYDTNLILNVMQSIKRASIGGQKRCGRRRSAADQLDLARSIRGDCGEQDQRAVEAGECHAIGTVIPGTDSN